MRLKIVNCTVKEFIGKIIDFSYNDKSIIIDQSKFLIVSHYENKLISYNCIFNVREV